MCIVVVGDECCEFCVCYEVICDFVWLYECGVVWLFVVE